VRFAEFVNTSPAKSSAFPSATAFLSNLGKCASDSKENISQLNFEQKYENDKECHNAAAQPSPRIIQPLIDLYYEEDEREDARQQNRRNSSPDSSPSHRHRRKD